ncbi:peptidylprolyl isomerase [Candidatus Bipolaricaulota bacterium]
MKFRSLVLLVFLSLLALVIGCSRQPVSPAGEDTGAVTGQASDTAAPDVAETPAADEPEAVPTGDGEVVIATINGRSVTRQDLGDATDDLLAQYQQLYSQFGMDIRSMLVGAEGRVFGLRLQSEALDRAFFALLIDMELERRGLALTEEQMDAEFETQLAAFLEQQAITRDQFETQLEEQGYVVDDFMANARASIAGQLELTTVQRAVSEPVDVAEEELVAYFEEHRTEYETEEQVKASHILVATEEEAVDVHLRLSEGADFAELARTLSTDLGSGQNGGELGWFGRGQMVPAFEEAVFALEAGQLSEIVETEFGFHIILLTDHRDATRPEYEDVTEQVLADVEAGIIEERFTAWYEQEFAAAETEVHDPLLRATRLQMEDVDAGLAAFEQIKAEGTVQEPYLSYIIGSIYEMKMNDAESRKTALEAEAADDPTTTARIAEIEIVIAETLDSTLAAYRDALDDLGGADAEIEAKIQTLAPVEAPAETP